MKPRGWLTAHPWRTAAVAVGIVLYGLLLAWTISTLSVGEEEVARRSIADIVQRPAGPVDPLPVMRYAQWPVLRLEHDPFERTAPVASPSATQEHAAEPMHYVATYRDSGEPYVLGRRGAGAVLRFRVGEKVDGATIARIDADRVILDAAGQQQAIEIGAEPAAKR